MNIEQLPGSRSADAAQKTTHAVPVSPQPVLKSDDGLLRDNVDMSMIGRIMAKSIKDLANDDQPRFAKIEQFKGFVDRPTPFADNIIDKMLRRMVG